MSAASIESAFVLIDKASGPTRRIRREVQKLRIEAERAGRALDDMAGPRQARQLDAFADETRGMSVATRQAGRDAQGAERDFGRLEVRTRGLTRETRRARVEVRGLGQDLRLLKLPALAAGVGGLTQAVGGLAGGAVALAPKLLDAGGAGAAMGNLFVGAAAGMGVAKLATEGLGEALDGNREAMKRLTPEGRAMVQMLREMRPEVTQLRREAQRGLFPGVGDLLGDLQGQAPALRAIVRQTAGDLGGLARWTGRQVSAPGFMRDLAETSDIGARAMGSAARSGFQLARAAEHIMIAAGPLTDWLGATVEGWAETAEQQAHVARETGKLDRFFDRTKDSLETLGDTAGHVFGGLGGLMDAARGQSDDLWGSVNDGAERFDDWSNSFRGQNKMRRWFDDVRPALDATVGLVGALGEATGELAAGPGGAQMIERLEEAIPEVAAGIGDLTANFGPAAIDALASGAELLGTLAGEAGPLTVIAKTLGLTAEAVTALIDALGPFGPAVGTVATSALLLKRLGLLGAATGGGGGGGLLAGAAGGALIGGGGRRSLGSGSTALVAGGAAGAGRLATMRAGVGTFAGDVSGRYGYARYLGYGRPGAALTAVGGAGRIAAGGGALAGGLGAAGRVAAPLMLVSAGLGALTTDGNALERVQGGLSAGSAGLFPGPLTEAQASGNAGVAVNRLLLSLPEGGGRKAQQEGIRRLQGAVASGGDTLAANADGDLNSKAIKEGTAVLRQELQRREEMLKESEQRARDSLAAKSVEHADALAVDFAGAFDIRSKRDGPEAAMGRITDNMLGRLRKLHPAGRRVLGETMLAWAQEQARHNPALLDEVEALKRGIERRFSRIGRHVEVVNGRILTGSQSEWKDIRAAITSQTELARQEATDDFTALQREAIGSLQAMGFSPSQARGLVRNAESGSRGAKRALRNPQAAARSGRLNDRVGPSGVDLAAGPAGDGIGNETMGATATATARSAGGGLMGADTSLAPYASLAGQYGGRVTSGLRPGAVTSSGNLSYHGSGDAIDVSGGNMMGFALAMAAQHGAGLEELIFSPLGWGIKNGRRVPLSTFGQQVIADHYDHVHVADVDPTAGPGGLAAMLSMDTAGPGMFRVDLSAPGSALGGLPGAASSAASGMYAAALEQRLNEALGAGAMPGGAGGDWASMVAAVGLPGIFNAIIPAESGGDPNALNASGATGLTQIMMPLHAQLVERAARMVGRPADPRDPLVNLTTAKLLYDQDGLSPWTASRPTWGGAMGDGLGWARPRLSMGGGRLALAGVGKSGGGGAGGGVSVHNQISISGGGHDSQRIVAVVDRRLEEFTAAVEDDLRRGGEGAEGAM